MEAIPAALHRQRNLHKPSLRRANSAELPPLRTLPPPITLNSLPSDIDLNVDYQTEVAPFLGVCLVTFSAAFASISLVFCTLFLYKENERVGRHA